MEKSQGPTKSLLVINFKSVAGRGPYDQTSAVMDFLKRREPAPPGVGNINMGRAHMRIEVAGALQVDTGAVLDAWVLKFNTEADAADWAAQNGKAYDVIVFVQDDPTPEITAAPPPAVLTPPPAPPAPATP